MSRPGTLYRFFDQDGTLLYVGATINGATRTGQHRTQDWWHEVASANFTHFASRYEALQAESMALASESPKYNRAGPRTCRTAEEEAERMRLREERDAELERTRPERERQYREETMYRVPGLHCTNCGWRGGWVPKGRKVNECKCAHCGVPSLRAGSRHLVAVDQATLEDGIA